MTLTQLLDKLDRDAELTRAEAWRHLKASIDGCVYAVAAGDYTPLRALAQNGRSIRRYLEVIEPVQEGDSPSWTAAVRGAALGSAMAEMTHRRHIPIMANVATLNRACTTAMALCPEGAEEVW